MVNTGFVVLIICWLFIQFTKPAEIIKVSPLLETGGSFVNNSTSCIVQDCSKKKPFKHSYCSPYACTSKSLTPLEVVFDVGIYQQYEEITSGVLYWTLVNPPQENVSVSWELFVNDLKVNSGTIAGCAEPPKRLKQYINIKADQIKVRWQSVAEGQLLIGRSNCRANSTDAYLQIEMARSIKVHELIKQREEASGKGNSGKREPIPVINLGAKPSNFPELQHVHDEL